MAYVYIVKCDNDSLYTGITTNLEKRMKTHAGFVKSGASKYMKSHKIVSIEAVWECDEYKVAAKLEYAVKRLKRAEKLELIQNPTLVATLFGNLSEYTFTPLSNVKLSDFVECDKIL